MHLSIKNAGKISEANIEIKGITVLAGENNTGKSTVGKLLFCIFNSLYKIDEKIEDELKNGIERILMSSPSFVNSNRPITINYPIFSDDEIDLKKRNIYIQNKEDLKIGLKKLYIILNKNASKYTDDDFPKAIENVANAMIDFLSIPNDEIVTVIFRNQFQAEFNMQINNSYSPDTYSEIILKIKNTDIKICVEENNSVKIENKISLNKEVMYIDNCFVLNNFNYNIYNDYKIHQDHLKAKLLKNKFNSDYSIANEIITTKKLDKIFEKLDSICDGEVIENRMRVLEYKEKNSKISLNMSNVSAGLKTFIIIKTLLLNGSLEENGTIILDEPEIHLHPEWQLVFAELIVLLQKEFNMHILLTTHSPYFLEAIELYSKKHGITDKCKYYLAENENNMAKIVDVSNNIEEIYKKLAKPLQTLENERYSLI